MLDDFCIMKLSPGTGGGMVRTRAGETDWHRRLFRL
jgi:hypothetical protein